MRFKTAAEQEERRVRHPFAYPLVLLSSLALPNFHRALETAVRTETRRRLAVVAVALERFRLLHGRYPDELAELVPAFLAVLPPDPYTAQAFGCRLRLSVPPKYSVSSVAGFIKEKSAIHIARVYAGRRRDFVGQHFWARLEN